MLELLEEATVLELRVGQVVGRVQTPGAASVVSQEELQRAAASIPMKRIGLDTDIAACALYLASPASAWVTGRTIRVDGGADAPGLTPMQSLRERIFGERERG